jgi:F-type H+-transporting ATPase subunit gamma
MISMQNASNNAKDVVGGLRLEYNKSRQAAITQELIEITTTKEYA